MINHIQGKLVCCVHGPSLQFVIRVIDDLLLDFRRVFQHSMSGQNVTQAK
ncbi:hypothetical protein HP15_1452 [Marinobacter adhaerens HP15]|uniref:Uncharacterized protein n=1 Tax=Marinobacter adhaerens (strain DSM 23420 / HP15) TaxID=225937 RepID=E4PKB9_MARAH|nr:hypothetical protein HP15_1452 [Marinobacter adhaerens HP15]